MRLASLFPSVVVSRSNVWSGLLPQRGFGLNRSLLQRQNGLGDDTAQLMYQPPFTLIV
jgi:hypothetical protein